ncbi:hypothetical protein [Lacipirellula limnantheis]|nr:hypothetical protein [Lacipirellula limnantheis]
MELPRRFNHPYRTLRQSGMDRDAALAEIRKAGASFFESMVAVKEVDGLTVVDSKMAVHCSPAWADEVKEQERFWDEAIAALEADPDLSP